MIENFIHRNEEVEGSLTEFGAPGQPIDGQRFPCTLCRLQGRFDLFQVSARDFQVWARGSHSPGLPQTGLVIGESRRTKHALLRAL